MSTESALPSYARLFGEQDLRADDARSVYSPAAYLADLLQLLTDSFEQPALVTRRPSIERVPLDAENTYTALPYLDIVNEVLAASLGQPDVVEHLRGLRHPAALPFSLRDERLRIALRHLGVDPAELYALFTAVVDADTTARLRLGLSADDVRALVIPAPAADPITTAGAASATETEAFRRAHGLSLDDLRAVLATGFVGRGGSEPPLDRATRDRVVRFVRLARRLGLTFPELDRALTDCCENRIDEPALRTLATLLVVARGTGLPIDVTCSLVAPMDAVGIGGGTSQSQFDRVFNAGPAGVGPVLLASVPGSAPGGEPPSSSRRVLRCAGDLLAPRNAEFRALVARALGVGEADLVAVVDRVRARAAAWPAQDRPFDRGDGSLADLSLLHRVARLAAALDITVVELFCVLDVLDADPSFPGYLSWPVPVAHEPAVHGAYRMLDASDVGASLCLVQALLAVVPWMRAEGLTALELVAIAGGAAASTQDDPDQLAVLQNLRDAFEEVALTADVFVSDRFGDRAAEVVRDILVDYGDGVVSARDPRLLQLDPEIAEDAAYTALVELGAVGEQDFVGLGLGDRLAEKIFTNLVHRGVLTAEGVLVEASLPPDADSFDLATSFEGHRSALADLLRDPETGEGRTTLYPSDLAPLGLTDEETAELYDNLVFHAHVTDDGDVLRPDLLAQADDPEVFAVDVDLEVVAPDVFALLDARVEAFRTEELVLDPEIFAPLALGDRLDDLLDSLRFNGYVDAEGVLTDKTTLAGLDLVDLNLALEFYPRRRHVLNALQDWLALVEQDRYTLGPDDFVGLADSAVAKQVAEALDGSVVVDGRVPADARAALLVANETPDLGPGFPPGDHAVVGERLAAILREQQPYQLDAGALTELGFDDTEIADLVAVLQERGDLTPELAVPRDLLEYFGTVHNAVGYTLPGLEDYGKDVFFLLHAVATELAAGIAEIGAALAAQADRQLAALHEVLQDAFGLPAATVEATCTALAGSRAEALELLVAPVLAAADPDTGELAALPADPHFRATFRRLRRFALLAGKLGLDADEVGVAFADQDLAGKFPEPLALPPGVDRIDALLESRDGTVYVFAGASYWAYPAATYALSDPTPRPLTDLSGRLATLAVVDAAFTDSTGTEWIVGRRADGDPAAFVRPVDSTRWVARAHVWGSTRNAFTASTTGGPARIDAAYVDSAGRTYLFRGGQYVRYSRPGHYSEVDEGYPRSVDEWWTGEGHTAPLPDHFRSALDAAFEGPDGSVHLFAGDRALTVANGSSASVVETAVAETWGRIRNRFLDAERIDAAWTDGSGTVLVAGNQVARYTDCLENEGVHVDDGFPVRIESYLRDVPAEFEGGLDAAFVDANRVVHLFKDGRTTSLSQGDGSVVPTAERWGILGPVLPSGTVDAAFVGLDGKTYLFSGDRYLRYSGADYAVVDVGYPRGIAGDWGGLRTVTASFVLDGATYLFGVAGDLLTLPRDLAGDLAAGRVSTALRQRLARQGITLPVDASADGAGPWRITAERGVRLVLTDVGTHIRVSCADDVDAPFYVRYSTRDYTTPDADHPRPLTDDWWSLPDTPAGAPAIGSVDAVFTGRDNRTYLFSGRQFVVFDHRRRWWSAPRSLQSGWDSLPFGGVDAAFVGTDGKTYVFSGPQYVRYSSGDYTKVDDRYPAPVTSFWGTVVNTIARTGHVDAALVVDQHTYLFSGDQYVRYTGTAYERVDDGYPRTLDMLGREPRFANLGGVLTDPVDAAFADRHTIHLFSGRVWQVVSDALHRTSELPARAGCAFVEDGAVLVEEPGGWKHYSSLEGATPSRTDVRPRTLRTAPPEFRTGLDAVLRGTDGNTYLFKGSSCHDTAVGRTYPLAEAWGRPRNTIADDNAVDAAFVGRDGRTYVFRGDQYVVYDGALTADTAGGPRPVTAWGGLTGVALAYVQDGVTHLFEKPDVDGTVRYVVYSGTDYTVPDQGYPATTDASFWDVPDDRWPADRIIPDAVLVEGEAVVLVCGEQYLQRTAATDTWSYPRPLSRLWRDLGPGAVTAAFTDRDGATHLFFDHEFTTYRAGASAPRRPVREVWARSRNNIADAAGHVDAAFVHDGTTTYLFSGDQYVRYSDPDYRFADPGYPRPLAGNLRQEPPFAALPEAFEDVIADRVAAGGPVVDAVVANPRTVFLFVGTTCHVVSGTATATSDIATLGRVRNTVVDRGRVDAALVADGHTYLFSGDQYVRYSGAALDVVDDGYPRSLASLPADLEVRTPLPDGFVDGLDAAFRGTDGATYLFAGPQFLRLGGQPQPIGGTWGGVRSAFAADGGAAVDAAFVAATGELYAFRGGQYVRYSPGNLDLVDEGYPRSIRDDWGDLPADFEDAIDGAFTFEGRTYLALRDSYVRYSDGYDAVDRTYPQTFRARWADSGDYRLNDVHVTARFARLAHAHTGADGGLGGFLAAGSAAVADPHARLGELLGWDAEQIRWLQRRGGFLGAATDERLDLELVLRLHDVFTVTDRMGAGPSRVHGDVWLRLFSDLPRAVDDPTAADHPKPADIEAALAALEGLLAQGRGPDEVRALVDAIHDELNVRIRDALVAAVLAKDPADTLRNPRDLFDRFLVDVEMGPEGRTSRVREAIAAAQLYVHRYLLNLEPAVPRGAADVVRTRVRTWWDWMRTYRVWEANRKVFLYPENYLRPELRATKTPAFRALESDLLQGEITPVSVQLAYKRYLDEYTEVSRLTIAGGYVYSEPGAGTEERSLVLFGRTKTDPRRYYYRRATFRSGDKLSSTWEPWLGVGVAIDADTVHPTHAFDRVFVFWATVESVKPDPAAAAVVTTDASGAHRSEPAPARQRVKIYYSFYNLAGEWVPAQELGASGPQVGTLSDLRLTVRAPEPTPGVPAATQGAIEVGCSWAVTVPPPTTPAAIVAAAAALAAGAGKVPPRSRAVFALYPQLYAEAVPTPPAEEVLPDGDAAVGALFGGAERIGPNQVVWFSNPSTSVDQRWFSVDHKGGSFLCRPAADTTGVTGPKRLSTNGDGLPRWSRIEAAVELDDGWYFFDDSGESYVVTPKGGGSASAPASAAQRFGRLPRPTPEGSFDTVLVRGDKTFVLDGGRYARYPTGRFDHVDEGYPRDRAGNPDGLPTWERIDAAVRTPGGVEYFFSRRTVTEQDRSGSDGNRGQGRGQGQTRTVVQALFGRAGQEPQPVPDAWNLKAPVDAAFVDTAENRTYLFAGNDYVRFSTQDLGTPDTGYPKPIADNTDSLPRTAPYRTTVTTPVGLMVRTSDGSWQSVGRGGASAATVNADGTRPRYVGVQLAWVRDGFLHLVLSRPGRVGSGSPPVPHLRRFALGTDKLPAEFPDETYAPAFYPTPAAAFQRDDDLYLLTGSNYARVPAGRTLDGVPATVPVGTAWADLSATVAAQVTGSLDAGTALFLFLTDDRYLTFPKDAAVPRPFELATMPREIVRLTGGTAASLNQLLLAGGVGALLSPRAQEIDESPRFRVDTDGDTPVTDTTVTIRATKVAAERLPASSHLDFDSANGLYYWEIFFHAPLLIAQALNEAQRFEEARRWYEYVFDPTEPTAYWRFLPFLALDVDALRTRIVELRATAEALWPSNRTLSRLTAVLDDLAAVAPAFRTGARLDQAQREALDRLASPAVSSTLANAERNNKDNPSLQAALRALLELTGVAGGLRRQYDRIGDRGRLLDVYRNDPFDPHAIAGLRPVAYRRTVVMAYVDNLLDWGDMLFRQHTAESLDEARMIYVLASDLLGAPPERLGTQLPSATETIGSLDSRDDGPLDLLTEFLTGGGALTDGRGAVHRSVASTYFHIPSNAVFDGYRERVDDRLRKIRASLDILGISRPVPLFEPPIDPMAAVRAAAGGVDAVGAAAAAAPVPHHRFTTVFRKAQELADKLRQSGADLLNVLEKRDAEELGLLQNRQEGVILGLTRGVDEAEVRVAAERLAELQAARTSTTERVAYYTKLIADGPSALQKEQIAMMTRGRDAHYASAGLKIAAAIAKAAPQIKVGPFILGFEIGGDEVGGALETAAEVSEGFGEAFSMAGELLGVQAEIERAAGDWEQQLAAARSDLAQLEHQVAGAEHQLSGAERRTEITAAQIAHQEAVATFLKGKFGNAELYGWMAGRLAGLHFDVYHMAYELARSAEQAYRFERGVPESEVAFIRPTYWESRRSGLLAGEGLAMDLERLGRAWLDGDGRGMEISKQVSLLELDPVAFLRLKSTGLCEFALTEDLLDRDFPGHYRRQIRTVTLTFVDADGELIPLNATLTQLGHKTVLAADPKAVKFLLAPHGQPPDTVRSDWRARQQVALSHVDERGEGSGLHELRLDDERYLPFEGTGAVSTWRLRLAGRIGVEELRDIVLTVRYTAEDGGEVFAAAVRGMVKPSPAARFLDVAAEFPDEWEEFLGGDAAALVLPVSSDLFPGMTNRDITGIYPTYDLAGTGRAQLVLAGERPIRLEPGRLLPTPGLRVGANGAAPWSLTVEGDKSALLDVGLVLTYKAGVA